MAATMLAACSKDVSDEIIGASENNKIANSLLQIRTRGTDDTTISYPVQVYVFNDNECCAMQTIGDAGQTLNIALVEGTYSIYAVGGASSTDYMLPSKDEAMTTTELMLKDGKSLTDLMAASATATLTDGGTNNVTLGLARKVMLLQNVSISKVPTAVSAVSVTIAPLWQNLTVGGTYSGTAGSQTIALTRQSDNRTWTATANAYLLPPSSQPASIGVNITIDGTTKTYTYSTSDELDGGYKININGTYTEAVGVSLTGTITGATWFGERTISFDFNESGASASNGSTSGTSGEDNLSSGGDDPSGAPSSQTGSLPTVGDTYQDCYVLASEVAADGESAEVTLLSPNEAVVTSNDGVTAALSTLGVGDISGWDVPTKAQMTLIDAQRASITGTTDNKYYLWRKNTSGYGYRKLGNSDTTAYTAISASWPTGFSIYLRPVAVITVNKE